MTRDGVSERWDERWVAVVPGASLSVALALLPPRGATPC